MSSEPKHDESKPVCDFTIKPEDLEHLNLAVAERDHAGSEAHRIFEESQRRWDKALEPEIERIQSAERLTQEDFSIRVNFRA